MVMSAAAYLTQLQALLPPGEAWAREPDAELTRVLRALAEELARIDTRAESVIREADPRTAAELIGDWEQLVGLPDTCVGTQSTVAERRELIVSRLTRRGGASINYFVSLAAGLGYEIAITEHRPFSAGLAKAGDPLTNGAWVFAWGVQAPEETVRSFLAGGNAGEPLRKWGNQTIECVMDRYRPAHTCVLFSYGG